MMAFRDGAHPAPPAALTRPVLRDQVKDRILQDIITGRYRPGARLIETRIARELGVSQGPVREALRDLESVGLVDSVAFRGARVRQPTPEELLEAFPVRAALESLAVSLAAQRIGAEELAAMEAAIGEMERAAERQDEHAQSIANASFHALAVQASGNGTLQRQWALLEPFARTYLTSARSGIDLMVLARRHRKILDPLRRRDGDQAAAAMREHLLEAARWLQE
ncbi:MAG: GntR family transcriptional regulator, partial [Candidatus Dormibacteraceae bacterium]